MSSLALLVNPPTIEPARGRVVWGGRNDAGPWWRSQTISERIMDFFSTHPTEHLMCSEISKRMGYSGPYLRDALETLVKRGEIKRALIARYPEYFL